MNNFSPATRLWFQRHFDAPTEAQALGWPIIAAGQHVLITAPTGSGKTLAAFLWAIDRLMAAPDPSVDRSRRTGTAACRNTSDAQGRPRREPADAAAKDGATGTRVLYLSPLKALVVDIERNLRAPLAGIARTAVAEGFMEPMLATAPSVAIRTGDTPAPERQRQLREPAEILVTTPESLYLLLGSRAAETLKTVETVIVDEVHALAATKRGAHLALSLERLSALVTAAGRRDPQRIGLSATVQPLAEAARWLGGDRLVEVVDAAAAPRLDLRVSVPVPDMERPVASARAHYASVHLEGSGAEPHPESPSRLQPDPAPLLAPEPEGGPILAELYRREQQHPSENRLAEKGLWSALYPALLAEVLAHRSTIIFVNSRGLCERLAQRLNELAAEMEATTGQAPGSEDDRASHDPTAWAAEMDAITDQTLEVDDDAAWHDPTARPDRDQRGSSTARMNPSRALHNGQRAPDDRLVPELVRAHHGSVSHQQRAEIEEALKQGRLRAIVATSSLEMGIDMGAVDQVLLVESPGSVARGLQRVGRAGHGVGEVSTGRLFPKYRGDLLECAVIAGRMREGALEPLRMPSNALDVLAQQLVAHCVSAPRQVDELLALVNRAGPYRALSREALTAVLEMLAGSYPASDFADLRPLLSWDRATDLLSPRKGAPMVSRLNAGTIPDRGLYGVHLGSEGPRIGELDEEMVFETRAGECILLGASTWRVEEISRDRVIVSPAPGEPGKLPFWRGDGPGRPGALGRAVGAFCRELSALVSGAGASVQTTARATAQITAPTTAQSTPRTQAAEWIRERTPLDPMAADNLAAYIQDQCEATGEVPSDRTLVVERFRDELGDWRICILTPFGAPVHGPWAMALQWQLERREGFEVQVMYTDDGIVLRLADGDELPALAELLPDPDEIEDQVTEQLAETALFASLFRENAGRALLLPRRSAKGRQPLWAQRLKAQNLLAVVRRYPAFPILLETYRQALSDRFDLPGLKEVLSGVRSRAIRVHEVETRNASPFARSLVFAYVAAYIYEQDAPLAERRAQALTLDRGLLAELLGEAELRALIDPEVLEALERELQHLGPLGPLAGGLDRTCGGAAGEAARVRAGEPAGEPAGDLAGEPAGDATGAPAGDPEGEATAAAEAAADAEAGWSAGADRRRPPGRIEVPDRRARDADELHDLLRRLGDLTPVEVIDRCRPEALTDRWSDAPAQGSAGPDQARGAARRLGQGVILESGARGDASDHAVQFAEAVKDASISHVHTHAHAEVNANADADDRVNVDADANSDADAGSDTNADNEALTWLDSLQRQRRAVQVRIAGERRWIAAEDAGLYRDALGCVPPPGLPEAFIAPAEAPLEQLLRRYARTRGPFTSAEAACRFGLRPAQLEPVLRLLEGQGTLTRGEIRPSGSGPEWCDAEVLRQLRRRTLARARDQVAPVDGATLGRFLPAWQGVGAQRRGPDRLLEALIQLEGLTVTWSQLDRVLLPARVPGYRSEDLDLLAASGQILWVGRGAAGPKDGRIALYRPETAAVMLGGPETAAAMFGTPEAGEQTDAPRPSEAAPGTSAIGDEAMSTGSASDPDPDSAHAAAIRARIVAHLRRRGACFLFELQQIVERSVGLSDRGGERATFEEALWDLVWAGRITNDTFAPLRSLQAGTRGQRAPGRTSPRRPRFGVGGRGGAGGLAGGRWSLVADLAGIGIAPLSDFEFEDEEPGLDSGAQFGLGPSAGADAEMTGSSTNRCTNRGISRGRMAPGGGVDRQDGDRRAYRDRIHGVPRRAPSGPGATSRADASTNIDNRGVDVSTVSIGSGLDLGVDDGTDADPDASPSASAEGAVRSRADLEREQARMRALTTERLLLQVQMLLERYGLVSREVIVAEGLSGGFGPYYKVLKQLEEAGRVRRGYFVEGLAGAQFALPAAVERLRAARIDETPVGGFGGSDVMILSAVDPANPYGSLLSWPESGGRVQVRSVEGGPVAANEQPFNAIGQPFNAIGRGAAAIDTQRRAWKAEVEKTAMGIATGTVPKRLAGAWLILVAGKPVFYLTASGRQLLTFPSSMTDEGDELFPALAALPRVPLAGRKRRLIQHIDGIPALESPLREALLAAGFEVDQDALVAVGVTPDAEYARRTQGRAEPH